MTMQRCHAERFAIAGSVLILGAWLARLSPAQQGRENPETVMATFHAKAGSEAELTRVIARHWTVARDLKLVRDTPHITLRGIEGGDKTYFVEIFTWREAGIPDAAPAEIQAVWKEMNQLVEPRGGRPGIDFVEVSVVAP